MKAWALVALLVAGCGGPRAPAITPPPPLPDTVEISSGAYVPEPGYGQVHGPITALTSEPHDGRVRWTYVVDGTSFAVELPPEIAFPAAQGDVVEAFARVTGGGPNAFGNVRLRDASGALLLCVDYLPDGWLADYGTPVSSRRGPDYDTVNYRARVSAPDGSRAELGSEWRKVMLAGARYLGSAYATKNLLHGDAPADFVREWIDVSLVRVSAP